MSKLIYVADDEAEILEVIQVFLEHAGYEVKTFASGDELYLNFQFKPADLVILDIMMPGTSGLIICKKLRQISDLPIIIISAKNSEMDRVTGITIGSDDYLVKPFSPMELVARIHSIFRRIDIDTGSKNLQKISYEDLTINISQRQGYVGKHNIDLTPTEFDFLLYLINRPEKAFSRKELMHNIWQMEVEVGTRVTDDVVKRLRRKLREANSNVYIETIWGFGFKLTRGE